MSFDFGVYVTFKAIFASVGVFTAVSGVQAVYWRWFAPSRRQPPMYAFLQISLVGSLVVWAAVIALSSGE
ncbi:MAG: hypothetical protein KC441_02500 [Anaerolineales bacterium]|nr:hypothetical protein [Anaerolineales bacterium]